jgi:hypothetical protein
MPKYGRGLAKLEKGDAAGGEADYRSGKGYSGQHR